MKPGQQSASRDRSLSGWHPAEVKAAIQMKGQTLSGLARQNHFTESYLRNTLTRPLYRGEQIIAKFLRVPAREIWPERYHTNGLPKAPGRSPRNRWCGARR